MKKYHWNLLLEPKMVAPKTGAYLFAVRDDNHISYDCHKMNEGDSFYKAVGTSSTAPTDWFVPIAYHFCNEFVGFNDLIKFSFVTEDSWYSCNSDVKTDGLRVLAFTLNGVLLYDVIREDCISFEKQGNLTYSEGYLYSDCYGVVNDQQDIKLVAYHYVELFEERGHSY